MQNEIERKFFVRELPDTSGITPLHYERYFLKSLDGEEERISKVNDLFFHEKKKSISNLERTREKREISEDEFENLRRNAIGGLFRDRYDLSENPKVSVQVYRGKYEGLMRAEVEFVSEDEAVAFNPFPWMGKEMTGLPIARDSQLLGLTEEEFRFYLR